MALITVNSEYLSQNHIEEVLTAFEKERYEVQPTIELMVTNRLRGLDILLIGYFILLKTQQNKLQITINFETEQSFSIIDNLKKYLLYAAITYGSNVFEIKQHDRKKNWSSTGLNWLDHIKMPGSYLPILLINSNTYSSIFDEYPGMSDMITGLSYFNDDDKLFRTYQEYVVSNLIREKDNNLQIKWLGQLATYKALSTLSLIKIHLDPEYRTQGKIRKDWKIGTVRSVEGISLIYEQLLPIIAELQKRPVFHRLLFSALLETNLISGAVTNNNYKNFISDVENLWNFTKTLATGLKELAKNICEHTDTGFGVLTARIYKSENWQDLKDDNSAKTSGILENFLVQAKKDGAEPMSFFDINIIDAGNIGVVDTLLNDCKNLLPEDSSKETYEDIDTLESRVIKLANFLDPIGKSILNQQAKRATAHIGLLFFSKLISENNGMLRASTWGQEPGTRDNVLIPEDLGDAQTVALCPFGTNYHIVIPIAKREAGQLKSLNSDFIFDSSAANLRSFEDFLQIQVVKNPAEEISQKNLVFLISPEISLSGDRISEAELWKKITEKETEIKLLLEESSNHICIDLKDTKINSSQLFRFAGKWETLFQGIPLIVFNVSTEIFHEMKLINSFYCQKNLGIPFWNKNTILVCYNYVDTLDGRFYFTDALWGTTEEENEQINRFLRKTNFNSTSLLKEQSEVEVSLDINNLKKVINRFNVFDSSSNLFPFDLVLESNNGFTLFEQNSLTLLGKELKQ